MSKELTIELSEDDYNKMRTMLEGLEGADRTNAVRTALTDGMAVIISEGKANLKARNNVVSGGLSHSFASRVYRKGGYVLGGFRRSSKSKKVKGAGNAAHLVDRGTVVRKTKKGYNRGSVSKGQPNKGSMFWTDSVRKNGDKAMKRLMDSLYQSISKIMNR